jgi:hypothetical protein
MNLRFETAQTIRPDRIGSESFPEILSSSPQMLERGDALEAWRAFTDGALEAVPHAFETYLSHNRFDLS